MPGLVEGVVLAPPIASRARRACGDARAGTRVRVRACEWVLLSAHACVVLACLRGSRSVCGGGKGRVHPGSETAYPEFFEAIKKIGLFHEIPI